MADRIDLTHQLVRVPDGTTTEPLEQAVDVSGYEQLDLLLGVHEYDASELDLVVSLVTGMDATTDDGWIEAVAFSPFAEVNSWERRCVRNFLRYVRLRATSGATASFSVRGLARRRRVPFQPTELPGLLAWYTADRGITLGAGGVARWADQSGHGYDLVQATTGAQPVYETESVAGRAWVRFDGIDDTLACASVANSATGLTVVATLAAKTDNGESVSYDRGGSGALVMRTIGAGALQDVFVGSAEAHEPAASRGAFEPIVAAVRTLADSGRLELWVDGVFRSASNLATDAPGSGTALAVGGSSGHAFAEVRVRQLVVYDRVLTELELADVTAALLAEVGKPDVPRPVAAPPLFVADWSAVVQPAGVTYTRSGTWLLIDDAAQSHLTSYGADIWGVETDGDGGTSLWVTPGYTNLFTAPRNWTNGSGNWATGRVQISS